MHVCEEMSVSHQKYMDLRYKIFPVVTTGGHLAKISKEFYLHGEGLFRGQHKHVDTRSYVAMKCKQGIFAAKWTLIFMSLLDSTHQ